MKSTPPRPPALCLAWQQAQSKGKESSLQPTRCHKERCTGWVIRPFQKAMHNTAWAAEPEGSVLSILLAELTPWQSCQQQGRVAVRPAALAHGAALTDAAASEAEASWRSSGSSLAVPQQEKPPKIRVAWAALQFQMFSRISFLLNVFLLIYLLLYFCILLSFPRRIVPFYLFPHLQGKVALKYSHLKDDSPSGFLQNFCPCFDLHLTRLLWLLWPWTPVGDDVLGDGLDAILFLISHGNTSQTETNPLSQRNAGKLSRLEDYGELQKSPMFFMRLFLLSFILFNSLVKYHFPCATYQLTIT